MKMRIETCPYCGEKMQKGTLPGEALYWLPEGKKPTPIRFTVPSSGVRLDAEASTFFRHQAEAFYCPACKIVIARTED